MKSAVASVGYWVVFVVLVVGVEQTCSLTTFFQQNKDTETNKTPPPPPVRGRECKADTDCNGIQNTICMKDPRDRKTRCLCVYKTAPVNGACPKTPKVLKASCGNDHDCQEGAHCSTGNSTGNSNSKACMCKEGFLEEDHLCNNGLALTTPALLSLIAFSFLRLVTIAV